MKKKQYWLTPPKLFQDLNKEFNFDFDPCPFPLPDNYNGLEVEWGSSNYVNPPFNKSDNQHGATMTKWVQKAIEENKKGKTVVLIFNTANLINMLIEAGAEMRSANRVRWLDTETKEEWKSPSCTTLFILKGKDIKNSK